MRLTLKWCFLYSTFMLRVAHIDAKFNCMCLQSFKKISSGLIDVLKYISLQVNPCDAGFCFIFDTNGKSSRAEVFMFLKEV